MQHVKPVFPPSGPDIIKEESQRLRRDALQAELRRRGSVEADENMPWKIDEMRPSPGFEDPPKSLVVAHAGSPKYCCPHHYSPWSDQFIPADAANFLCRGKSGGGYVHDDDAPNGFEDAPDSIDSAANGSNAASHGSNDELDSFNNTANGSNISLDRFNDPVTTPSKAFVVSSALGGTNREESVTVGGNRPRSLSEDTNTLIMSFSGP